MTKQGKFQSNPDAKARIHLLMIGSIELKLHRRRENVQDEPQEI